MKCRRQSNAEMAFIGIGIMASQRANTHNRMNFKLTGRQCQRLNFASWLPVACLNVLFETLSWCGAELFTAAFSLKLWLFWNAGGDFRRIYIVCKCHITVSTETLEISPTTLKKKNIKSHLQTVVPFFTLKLNPFAVMVNINTTRHKMPPCLLR